MYQAIDNPIIPAAAQAAASAVVPTATSFEFQQHPVRVVMVDGTECFIAKDLAPILSFKNARQAVRTHVSRPDRYGVQIVDTMRRDQTVLAVNESGLYALILGSTKPEAREFKRWVTAEVLPTLRKTGRYELGTAPLLVQITALLRGRGAAKERQLNRIVAHRDGTFSVRVGRHWTRHIRALDTNLPRSHSLREGLALDAFRFGHTNGLIQ
jgi:prophage antirepressor-like protein